MSIGTAVEAEGEARNGNSSFGAAFSPLFGDVQHGEIQHLEQAVICQENSLGFSHLTQLPIEAFYGIGRINQPPKLLRELEICAEICPVFLSGF